MKLNVGQVIYVIITKKGQVYPMMVIEEIIKKSLRGEEVNYVLQAGSNPSNTILLNDIEGEVYATAKEAKTVLIGRATEQIEKIIQNSVKKAEEWYSKTEVEQETSENSSFDEDEHVVTLPDGTTARLKFPT